MVAPYQATAVPSAGPSPWVGISNAAQAAPATASAGTAVATGFATAPPPQAPTGAPSRRSSLKTALLVLSVVGLAFTIGWSTWSGVTSGGILWLSALWSPAVWLFAVALVQVLRDRPPTALVAAFIGATISATTYFGVTIIQGFTLPLSLLILSTTYLGLSLAGTVLCLRSRMHATSGPCPTSVILPQGVLLFLTITGATSALNALIGTQLTDILCVQWGYEGYACTPYVQPFLSMLVAPSDVLPAAVQVAGWCVAALVVVLGAATLVLMARRRNYGASGGLTTLAAVIVALHAVIFASQARYQLWDLALVIVGMATITVLALMIWAPSARAWFAGTWVPGPRGAAVITNTGLVGANGVVALNAPGSLPAAAPIQYPAPAGLAASGQGTIANPAQPALSQPGAPQVAPVAGTQAAPSPLAGQTVVGADGKTYTLMPAAPAPQAVPALGGVPTASPEAVAMLPPTSTTFWISFFFGLFGLIPMSTANTTARSLGVVTNSYTHAFLKGWLIGAAAWTAVTVAAYALIIAAALNGY